MVRKNFDFSTVLIAGPTASGKSALALAIAEEIGGVVINADSMQVYRGLAILTAQPPPEDLEAVPHRLYGFVDPQREFSTGAWMREVAGELQALAKEGRPAVFVGGTGLYFRALLGGIDEMPPVPAEIRERVRRRMAEEGPAVLHEELAGRDPEAARRIRASDPQRISRALELVLATGRSLGKIQTGRGEALVDEARALKLVLAPERSWLRAGIAARFEAMVEAGALDEARRFEAGGIEAGITAGKAIGLSELLDHLAGRTSLAEAMDRAVTRSRQYAKRQDTWFRHQLDERWTRVDPAENPNVSSFLGTRGGEGGFIGG